MGALIVVTMDTYNANSLAKSSTKLLILRVASMDIAFVTEEIRELAIANSNSAHHLHKNQHVSIYVFLFYSPQRIDTCLSWI